MRETVFTVLMVVLTFGIFVILWRLVMGYYPGSKVIISDPPIAHNGLDPKQAKFMFFYTRWCPYSHQTQAPWRSFKQQMKNVPVVYGGKEILFEEIDAESDKGKAALYRITEYPSFRLETSDKLFSMSGAGNPVAFDTFLESSLGQKAPHK